ncbi:hypothetical protein HYH03_017414 [Edaphochlamys debaryana]|uniref:SRCR domain-containing protein n=1 Tax=Edaphochlamys debaryana TaxID=47281 RepID=A0A836BQG8_9CHLO|nr:hypothetical protein HYH03_017414 [Edaphochlamys debaryana]|eukprot:KAG2483759.1 hypothetical protein HYH03_017414 [Edaphochlamys debaryana]
MFDCVSQLAVLDRAVEDCAVAAQLVGIGRSYMPIAITCRNVRKGRNPSVPPAPPPPPPLRFSDYTMRIVDPATGMTENEDGTKVSDGRLEVLLPDATGVPVWGTVCYGTVGDSIPDEWAEYACRQSGLPYGWASASYSYAPWASESTPVHLIAAKACAINPVTASLGCQLTLNATQAAEVLEKYKDDWSPLQGYFDSAEDLEAVITECANNGHRSDVRVSCFGEPVASPPPPAPKVEVRNDVVLEYETHFDSMYTFRFGARAHGAPATDPLFWGTACLPPQKQEITLSNIRLVGHTLCNQITDGERPYGVFQFIYGLPFVEMDDDVIKESPVSISSLECDVYGGSPEEADVTAIGAAISYDAAKFVGVPKNISFCKATIADPIPNSVNNTCRTWRDSMAQSVLVCRRQDYTYTTSNDIINVRLTGGDGTWGRVEVLDRRYLMDAGVGGWRGVCAPVLTLDLAQAICRDLGLDWRNAALLPPALVSLPEKGRRIDSIYCASYPFHDPREFLGEAAHLSFLRDCYDDARTRVSQCDARQSAAITCGGLNAMPSPAYGSNPPMYGPYGGSPPPAYGPYGGSPPPAYGPYGGSPPPVYGPYGTY